MGCGMVEKGYIYKIIMVFVVLERLTSEKEDRASI